jgi:LEA14-like dessication related protein
VLIVAPLALAGCGAWRDRDPPKVLLAGVEALPGQGMELRLAVKLRVQNPNDAAIDFDGLALDLEVRGMDFASGVSDQKGSVPRFGETVITVPVTVSVLALARQAYAWSQGERGKIDFVARGKLAGTGLSSARFTASGAFELPVSRPAAPR